MKRTIDIELEFQPYIEGPPHTPGQLLTQAASNDTVTIDSWRDVWIKMVAENHKLRGPFKNSHIGQVFNTLHNRACIVAGAGPSLKTNIKDLVKASKFLPVISCLHNFHYFEDNDVKVEYYVTLDAGPITVTEVSEGGSKTTEEYWALTKDRTLIAFIGCCSELIAKWQGKVIWFNAPIPDKQITDEFCKVELLNAFVSTGGNVGGACFYIAKGIMAANPIIFVGADFGFSYDKKFHGWDSSYDAQGVGQGKKVTDIFGNRIWTWQSYLNFKLWTDRATTLVPGLYINATEGGCLGSYPEGNIRQIIQMSLAEVVAQYSHCEALRETYSDPSREFRGTKDGIMLLF